MPANIHRNQMEIGREIGVQLFVPCQAALREAVNEEDGLAVRIAGCLHMQLQSPTPSNGIRCHRASPGVAGGIVVFPLYGVCGHQRNLGATSWANRRTERKTCSRAIPPPILGSMTTPDRPS